MLLRSIRQPLARSGTDLPTRIKVGNWGRNKSVKGDYEINDLTVSLHPRVLQKLNYDTCVLDFNHNTVKGSPAYEAEKEPRKIAANGTIEIVKGEGAFFIPLSDKWTPEGRDAVLGNHFADVSPTLITNAAGEVLAITSAGLCRQGATEDLHLELHSADLSTLLADAKKSTHSDSLPTMDKYKALLLTLLGLSDTADDAAIETAAKGLAAKVDGATKAATDATKTADGAAAEVKTCSAELKSLRLLVEGNEKDIVLRQALAAGKLVTQSIADLPIESLKKVLADLPANQVPLEKRTPDAIKTMSSDVLGGDSAVEAEVNRQLGIKAKA